MASPRESVPRGNRPAPDLGELRRLLEAATPGPWRVDPGPAHDPTDYEERTPQHPGYGWHNDGDECIGPDCINPAHFEEPTDD